MTAVLMTAALVKFVTLDPGHFHASLVQNRAYPEVSPEVAVFAYIDNMIVKYYTIVEAWKKAHK